MAQTDIDAAERAVGRAFTTGRGDRAAVTRQAKADAEKAVEMADIAIESDEAADEAARISVIASGMGDREKARAARARERAARRKAKEDHASATKSARKAYEAIKFSDPTKLGFMRFVQIMFLVHIIATLFLLVMTSRDTIVYNSAPYIDWITVILEGVAFYFFWNRYKLARPLVIAIAAIAIVGNIASGIISNRLVFADQLWRNAYYIFLILYFTFSKRVKSVLINDLSQDKGNTDENFVIDRTGWPFIRNLIIYFVVFSVLGHWMEAAFCQLIRLGIVAGEFHPENTMLWRDWFYPYPMHGTAVILIALILNPLFELLKKKLKSKFAPYVVSFVINGLVCTLIEFCGGLMFNAHLENWDYSNMPFNFMGQVCLQNAVGFAIASSVIAWWLYPAMERMIARVRPATMNIVCVVVAIAGGILFSLYAISPPAGIDANAINEQANETKRQQLENIATMEEITRESNRALGDRAGEATDAPQSLRDDIKERTQRIDQELEQIDSELQTQILTVSGGTAKDN